MSTLSIRKDIVTYLRDVYGVRQVDHVQNNHAKLAFEYGGRSRTITLPVSPNHDDRSAISMKRQDIRRELGPPPTVTTPTKRRRTMEEMMPQLFNTPLAALAPLAERLTPSPSLGGIAKYKGGDVRIFIPNALFKQMPGVGYSLELLRDKGTITPLSAIGGGRRWKPYGPNEHFLSFWLDNTGLTDFGRTPARYSWDSGRLSFEFDSTNLSAIKSVAKKKRGPLGTAHLTRRAPLPIQSQTPSPAPRPSATHDEMRACLAEIRRIEAMTDRRLMRRASDKAWVFSAEVIE